MNEEMSILELKVNVPEGVKALQRFREDRFRALKDLSEEVRLSVADGINRLLDLEMSLFLGEAEQTENKRNGYQWRDYTIKGLGTIRIRMPRDRSSDFKSVVVPPRERLDPRLKQDLAVLHLAGISNRTLGMISRRILGLEVSKDTVQRSLEVIEVAATNWLTRPLSQNYWALYVDGTNFKVQRRNSTEREPALVVLGIGQDNHRSVLAIEPGYKDSSDSWRSIFADLKRRGLPGTEVQIGIMDGLPGLEAAFLEHFPRAKTARCWVHALRNATARCPARLRLAFQAQAKKVMYAKSQADARRAFEALKETLKPDAVRALGILEKDIESLLVHYEFPEPFWRCLKTTNPIERVNRELKRRYRSMDSIGEKTLTALMAFTALRLEMGWRLYTVNDSRHEKLDRLQKLNPVEETIGQLTH